jgi:hypothetical protein
VIKPINKSLGMKEREKKRERERERKIAKDVGPGKQK